MIKPTLADNILAYIGRKGQSCINAQIVCDRRLYIMNVLVRFPGATNDSHIYQMSAVRRKVIDLNEVEYCCLVGDSGYPIEPWLLTPYARQDAPLEDSPEERYNKIHCCDRNCVERCIGLLKAIFRALHHERTLHYSSVKVGRLILACCVLHNMRILARLYDYADIQNARNDNVNEDEPELDDFIDEENYAEVLRRGRELRQEVADHFECLRNERVQL